MSYIPPSIKLSTKAFAENNLAYYGSGLTITGFSSGDSNLVIFIEAAYTAYSGDNIGSSLNVSPPFTSISTIYGQQIIYQSSNTNHPFVNVYVALNTSSLSGVSITYSPFSATRLGSAALHATAFTYVQGSSPVLFSPFGGYTSSYSRLDRSFLYEQSFYSTNASAGPLNSGATVIDSFSTNVADGSQTYGYTNAYKNYPEGVLEIIGWSLSAPGQVFVTQYPTLQNHFSVATEWNMQSSPATTSFGYTFTSSDSWTSFNDIITPDLTGLIKATIPTSPYPVVGSSKT